MRATAVLTEQFGEVVSDLTAPARSHKHIGQEIFDSFEAFVFEQQQRSAGGRGEGPDDDGIQRDLAVAGTSFTAV